MIWLEWSDFPTKEIMSHLMQIFLNIMNIIVTWSILFPLLNKIQNTEEKKTHHLTPLISPLSYLTWWRISLASGICWSCDLTGMTGISKIQKRNLSRTRHSTATHTGLNSRARVKQRLSLIEVQGHQVPGQCRDWLESWYSAFVKQTYH